MSGLLGAVKRMAQRINKALRTARTATSLAIDLWRGLNAGSLVWDGEAGGKKERDPSITWVKSDGTWHVAKPAEGGATTLCGLDGPWEGDYQTDVPKSDRCEDCVEYPWWRALEEEQHYRGDDCTVCGKEATREDITGDTPAWGRCEVCMEEMCPEHQVSHDGATWCSACIMDW